MCFVSHNLDCVVFNVGFRNGPEVKVPTGQQDMADCVLHILDNASKFGVDPNKASMAGISGGGWIAVGAMNLLVKAGQSHRLRALFVHTAMLSHEVGKLPEEKLEPHENTMGAPAQTMLAIYKLHATDFENQSNDDQLYPGKASDDILKKYPPTVIWTSEFDFLRRDNETFAKRLDKVGKLAALGEMPGVGHGYQAFSFKEPENIEFYEQEKLAFKHLVDK